MIFPSSSTISLSVIDKEPCWLLAIHDDTPSTTSMIPTITSCTNTSNPRNVIAAGLLARRANALGLTRKPWVKTSLAPGSKVVTDYLEKAGLLLPSRPDEAGQAARRPADVYVPAWSSGSPAAFDFAVPAPQQAQYREAAALEPLAAASAYTPRKKNCS